MFELTFERRMSTHILPLWHTPSESKPLTPFLEEIQELVLDYARRIVASQKPQQRKDMPLRGPTKKGTGVRQVRDGEVR